MPANPRQAIKQKLTAIVNEISRASIKITELQATYTEGQHPEIAETLEPWVEILKGTIVFLDAFNSAV